ncbi:MAG: SRPBCC family protein [Bacteroidia bacterium]
MNIIKTIEIEKQASDVWSILSEDFDKVYQWMAPVYRSYKIPGEEAIEGAAMAGRICEFTSKPGGFHAEERITAIDQEKMSLNIEVLPKNAPTALPLKKNILVLTVESLGEGKSKVTWSTFPELKGIGVWLSPLVKKGLSKSFGEVLEELKYFVETGNQHPRKVKKSSKKAA